MQIEISAPLFKRLQRLAVPLVDTMETVIERAVIALENKVSGREEAANLAPPIERLNPGPDGGTEMYVFTKPHMVKLAGKEYSVWNWKDVLPLVARELLKVDKQQFMRSAEKFAGRKKQYISKSTHGMESPRKIPGSDLYIETNFSADHTVQRCRELLRLNGGNIGDFAVLVSQR